jgi:phospholipase C
METRMLEKTDGKLCKKVQASAAGKRLLALFTVGLIALGPNVSPAFAEKHQGSTATPIQHLVVVFQENVSFDHYFGTYPNAANPAGEPQFHARPGTPTVNGYSNALPLPAIKLKSPEWRRCNESVPSGPVAGGDHGSGPRLYGRTTGIRQGAMDLFPFYAGTRATSPGGITSTNGLNLATMTAIR